MLVKFPVNKTVPETAAALEAAVKANHFGVMQVHDLRETMAKKGVEFTHALETGRPSPGSDRAGRYCIGAEPFGAYPDGCARDEPEAIEQELHYMR